MSATLSTVSAKLSTVSATLSTVSVKLSTVSATLSTVSATLSTVSVTLSIVQNSWQSSANNLMWEVIFSPISFMYNLKTFEFYVKRHHQLQPAVSCL